MMNLNQAIAYGNQMGVKFYVRNSNGGLRGLRFVHENGIFINGIGW